MRKLLALAVTLLALPAGAQVVAIRQGCPSAASPPIACSTAANAYGRCYTDTDDTLAYRCNGTSWILQTAGNSTTATALAADPVDCSLPNVALGINASGTAQCAQPSNVTGNAATATLAAAATALAGNPADCSSNQHATSIAASGDLTCAGPGNGTGAFAGTASPSFTTPALGVATGTSVMLNGATAGTANVIGVVDTAALGAVTDWAAVRVQSAPSATNANGVAFGTYSTITNTSSTVGVGAHMVGQMGNFTDTTAGRIAGYGGEFRVDGRSTDAAANHSYVGGSARAFFQGSSLSNSVNVIGAEAFCNITTDGSTPLANGNCLAVYIPAGVGGNARYAIYAAADSIYAGGGIDVQNLSDTTIARSSAGHISVEGSVVALASDHLGFFAATTSAQLAGVLSDETGSGGGFVRATSPTIATPSLTGATITAAAAINSDLKFSFGTAADGTVGSIGFNTNLTPDGPVLYTGTLSNSWQLMEGADSSFGFNNGPCGASACTDPTLIFRSRNQAATEWGSIRHDGTDMIFQTGVFGGHFRFSNGGTSSGIIMESGTLLDLIGSTLRFNGAGSVLMTDRTLTAAGTTGAQTINKMSGSVNVAAGASTLVVTNSVATATSLIWATAMANDTTCALKDIERASGSFTIRMTANCTAETTVGFLVSN